MILHLAIRALSGRALLHRWQKETTLHSGYSSAHLMRYSLRNSTGLGNSITCGQMKCFFNKTFLIRHSYKPLSSSPHSSTYRVAKTFLKKSVQKSVHLQKKIRTIFEKKFVQFVQFSKKHPYNPYIFLKIRKFFLKICTISTIFEKNH